MSKTTIIIVLIASLSATANADTLSQLLPTAEALLNADTYETLPTNPVTPEQLIPNTPGQQDLIYPVDPVNTYPINPVDPIGCVFPKPMPIAEVTPQDFIGLSLEDAKNLADAHGLRHRTRRIDDQHFMGTADYQPARLNFEVDNGCVTKCTKG